MVAAANRAEYEAKVWDQWLAAYQVYLTNGSREIPFPDFDTFLASTTRTKPAPTTDDDLAAIKRRANRTRKRYLRAQEGAG